MAKRIVYTAPNGSVAVVCPAPGLVMEFHRVGKATGDLVWTGPAVETPGAFMPLLDAEAAAVAFVLGKDIPPGAMDIRVCEQGDLLVSRRFRTCWRRSGMAIPIVDMPLARTQRMNEVRQERQPRLEKSDVDLLRAQEKVDVVMQDKLKTYRQGLRDLPATEQPNVDALTTPELLVAWKPAWPVDPAL